MKKKIKEEQKCIKFSIPIEWVETGYQADQKYYRVIVPVAELKEVVKPLLKEAEQREREKIVKILEGEMVKVPPTRDCNTPRDCYFNLGILRAIEKIKQLKS